eukprot:XP_003726748.1 PREDICTED: RNA-directed DNA polymerase from mobile element jockey-like [Strongylocentrotus purpuratus]
MTSRSQCCPTIDVPGYDQSDPSKIADTINKRFVDVASNIRPLQLCDLPSYLPSQRPPTVQPWEVYRELQRLKPGKSAGPDGVPTRLIRTFAYEIAYPLTTILNSSFAEGEVPNRWKKAIVVPIPKEKPARIDKLRPIALTDHFVKVAELFITKWLMSDISSKLDAKQFGSRPGRSTTHCLVDIVNFLTKQADKLGTTSTLVTTDFSKAFDKVDHTVVISKLIHLVSCPSLVPWISNFLTGRTQCVRYQGVMSTWAPVNAGVPQGTRLGPILFLVLINDALASSNLEHWKYVDDMTIAEARPRGAAAEIHNTLSELNTWCNNNAMQLNASKCHVMRVNFGKTQLPPINVSLGDQTLDEVQTIKALGVLLQTDLKWNSHNS